MLKQLGGDIDITVTPGGCNARHSSRYGPGGVACGMPLSTNAERREAEKTLAEVDAKAKQSVWRCSPDTGPTAYCTPTARLDGDGDNKITGGTSRGA